jgi:predicted RecA/RadA family phage recombinase
MKNYVQRGDVLDFVAPSGGVVSGTPVKIGRFFVIPATTNLVGETFSGAIEGVFDLPKVAAEPWTAGLMVWWNSAASLVTSVSTTAMFIGLATRTEANPTATGRVKLNYGSWLNQ